MKMLISLFALVLSLGAMASSGETKSFIYDGSRNSIELVLRGVKTHTEYRNENRQSTCYRTEIVGYRNVCTGGGMGQTTCHSTPRGRICQTFPGPRYCHTEPIYRQVAYSCIQTTSIPYEVTDYDVDARVIVDVTKVSEELTPGETINVKLDGDSLTFDVVGSKKFFIVEKKRDIRSSMSGSVKMIDGLYAVELIEAAPVLKAIKMTNIAIENSVLNFDIGQVATRANIGFSLKIEKKKFLGSDKVLLDRALLDSEVEVKATAEGAEAGVNVTKLGVTLEDGKFELTAKAFAKFDGVLKNKAQFGDDLEASRTLIYKVR